MVKPYNDQRRCIEAALATDRAGDVVVGVHARNADLLFSKNRLNVATSRARCLAYLICTDDLLDTRARIVEEMALVSVVCSFVERAITVCPPA